MNELEIRDEIYAAKLADHHSKIDNIFRLRDTLSPLEFASRFAQEREAGTRLVEEFLAPILERENISDESQRKRLCEVGLAQSAAMRSKVYRADRLPGKSSQNASDDDAAVAIDHYQYNIVQGAIARMNGRAETV